MSEDVFIDMLEDDPEDRYPSPEHLQLIQFEGCTSGVIAPESYEELFNKVARLQRERDEARSELKLEQSRVWAAMLIVQNLEDERDELRARVAELEFSIKRFRSDYQHLKWGWDGDCGATALVDRLFESVEKEANHG